MTKYQQLEELKAEHISLVSQLRVNRANELKSDNMLNLIRTNEAKRKNLKLEIKVDEVNKEQKDLRDAARAFMNVGIPPIDVINQDGSLHSTKLKKYPKLRALHEAKGVRFSRGYSNNPMYEAIVGRHTLQISDYKGEKFVSSYEELLEMNNIEAKPLSLAKVKKMITRNEKENQRIKAKIDKFEANRKASGMYDLVYHNILGQRSENLYLYSPNY